MHIIWVINYVYGSDRLDITFLHVIRCANLGLELSLLQSL